jgi:hypothetical protein
MKMHVFVDKQGSMVAAGPAPEAMPGRAPATKTPGPVYAGSSPGPESDGLRAFELEIEDTLIETSRDNFGEALQARVSEAMRSQRGLKPVEILR